MTDLNLLGQTLGNFEVLSALERKEWTITYRAYHRHLDRIVALKVLQIQRDNVVDLVDLFLRGARIGGKIEHKYILPIYDAGTINGYHYIASKYVEGGNLESKLLSQGLMSIRDALVTNGASC